MWTKKSSDQFNLAHIARKKTKTNKRQCPLSSVHVQDPWRQPGKNKNDYEGKDLWR